jgi:simple sugar transport system substrate-binding protein
LIKSSAAAAILSATGAVPRVFADDVLKVGVVQYGPVGEVGWEKQHALALSAMEEKLGGKVKSTVITDITQPQDAERVFRDLASKGHRLIFGTTFSQMAPMLKVAPSVPDTHFECNTAIKTLPNMGAFEARYYEGYYIAGVLAGRATKSNVLGWVGAFPYPNVLMALNGFALGARSVNANAVVKVIWINSWSDPSKEKDAVNALISQGADVVSGNPNTPIQATVAEEKNAWSVGFASDYSKFAPNRQLTSVILDWSSAYVSAAEATLANSWKSEDRWLGVAPGGYVKLAEVNSAVAVEAQTAAKAIEADIVSGKLHPFAGPLEDQDGNAKVAAGSNLSDPDIRSMNWVVKGVEGKVPG